MISLKINIPLELKDFVIFSIENFDISNWSCFEDESSEMSDFFDEDGLPVASMFIIECICNEKQYEALVSIFKNFSIEIEKQEFDNSIKYSDSLNDIEVYPFFITKDDKENKNFPHIIKIQAATAFGSGDHQTTKGCLTALSYIKNDLIADIKYIADIGCGSGILAIAAKKLWLDSIVKAVDNDEESVKITNFHKDINESSIEVICGDGIKPLIDFDFDLIISNILAKPLISFADDFINRSKKYIVLSGFLEFQKNDVINAYSKLNLKKEIVIDDWVTLIFEK